MLIKMVKISNLRSIKGLFITISENVKKLRGVGQTLIKKLLKVEIGGSNGIIYLEKYFFIVNKIKL
jgi:hypothetical protein